MKKSYEENGAAEVMFALVNGIRTAASQWFFSFKVEIDYLSMEFKKFYSILRPPAENTLHTL